MDILYSKGNKMNILKFLGLILIIIGIPTFLYGFPFLFDPPFERICNYFWEKWLHD